MTLTFLQPCFDISLTTVAKELFFCIHYWCWEMISKEIIRKNSKSKLRKLVIFWTRAPLCIERKDLGDMSFYEWKYFTKNKEEKTKQIWHAKLLIRSSQAVYTEGRCVTKSYKEKRKVQRSICSFFWSLVFYREIIRKACYAMWQLVFWSNLSHLNFRNFHF